jgi:pimeloyl-ACP methyl ester carboxylesterase
MLMLCAICSKVRNMKQVLMLFLAIFVSMQMPDARANPKYLLYQKMLKKRRAETPAQALVRAEKAKELIFPQLVDHFSPGTHRTFSQHYFIDDSDAKDTSSPVILYVCGEGACEGPSATPVVNAEAKKYHAYRIAIEHRYYGQSQPFATLSTENLKYLSMDQAIEDIATLQRSLQASMHLSGKWIVVGGSYAGELSAFYRLKHPELVVGSLASSAPVLAKADFFEYDEHTASVVPPACLAAIQSVTKDVETKLLQTDSAAAVKKLFNASGIANSVDFLYVVADMAATAIQYGFKDEFCNKITNVSASENLTEAFAKAGLSAFQQLDVTPMNDWVDGAKSLKPSDYSGTGMRAWLYQSCTEFGYYQIANPNLAESARSQQITTAYHDQMCSRLFGVTTPVNTAKTNSKFFNHLANQSVTNIFFTNGSDDPWSTLSLEASSQTALQNPALRFFTLLGGSHCSDLEEATTDAIKSANAQFDTMLAQWLQ